MVERLMETEADEGTPGHERRDGREQGKGLVLLALQGGSIYVYKKGTFLYRENGWSMHSNNRKGRWPRPLLL